MFSSVLCKSIHLSPCIARAQNNFWTVAGHINQPKKFLLRKSCFLTSQKVAEKMNWYSCCFLLVNVIVFFQRKVDRQSTDRFFGEVFFTITRIWLFVQERLVNMTGKWSLWPVKMPLWLDIVRWTAVVLIPRCKEPFHFSYLFYAIKVLQWKVWMQKSFHK